jgi:hypothetical protein
VERFKLVERRENPSAASAITTAEPTLLLAGQCAWKKFTAKDGVVGRYRLWLPAEREITVRVFVLPANVFLSYRLMLGGKEAPLVSGERTVFKSIGEGEYELEVALRPSPDGGEVVGEYSVQVHWGHGVGDACPVPSFDRRECYGIELPKEMTP